MDLRPIEAQPTQDERDAVDAVVGSAPLRAATPLGTAQQSRHLLLPALQAIQARAGWISPGALGYACRRLDVPPADGYGVASFYSLLSLTARPPVVAHVCDDIACRARGAGAIVSELERRVGAPGTPGTGATAGSTWHTSPCLGLCEQAPAALLVRAGREPVERGIGRATVDGVIDALAGRGLTDVPRIELPQRDRKGLRILARVGHVDPTSIDDYRAHGGYRALQHALALGAANVIREIVDSNLVGRGGAAFPTGRKWDAVSRAPTRPHYVICNADESEPGTFKDRVLMEGDPFAVIEAMTIAGYATGCEKGFVYLRGEYPLAFERIRGAVAAARRRGLLGNDILGKGLGFDIEIRRGAGAYVCGEETALMSSIEGRRGEPRNKPPYPVEAGLFGKPTCIQNVETLVNVLPILVEGAAAYRGVGTAESAGTRLFCVSGSAVRPGVYELPFGARLSELLALAGGVRAGRRLCAVLLGGAAGTFLGPGELDVPLTFEDTRKLGATLGSGAVVVFDDTVRLPGVLARIARFFRDESCGQCAPCRVGTVRQEELVARVERGAPLGSLGRERALIEELGRAMRDASICGLGQAAASALKSAAKLGLFDDAEGDAP